LIRKLEILVPLHNHPQNNFKLLEAAGAGGDKKLVSTTVKQVQPGATDLKEPIDALKEHSKQKEFQRQRRMHRMKGSLARGFGTLLGSSVAVMDFDMDDSHHDGGHDHGGDIQDGDVIDSDQSWSGDDEMDGDDNEFNHDRRDQDDRSNGKPAGKSRRAAASVIFRVKKEHD
jgi:hypothetical protein